MEDRSSKILKVFMKTLTINLRIGSKITNRGSHHFYLPLILRKAGSVMWWRTRDTRATCHDRVTVIKMKHFLKSP